MLSTASRSMAGRSLKSATQPSGRLRTASPASPRRCTCQPTMTPTRARSSTTTSTPPTGAVRSSCWRVGPTAAWRHRRSHRQARCRCREPQLQVRGGGLECRRWPGWRDELPGRTLHHHDCRRQRQVERRPPPRDPLDRQLCHRFADAAGDRLFGDGGCCARRSAASLHRHSLSQLRRRRHRHREQPSRRRELQRRVVHRKCR